jgi:hypothetical protein
VTAKAPTEKWSLRVLVAATIVTVLEIDDTSPLFEVFHGLSEVQAGALCEAFISVISRERLECAAIAHEDRPHSLASIRIAKAIEARRGAP